MKWLGHGVCGSKKNCGMRNSPKRFLQRIWDLYAGAATIASIAKRRCNKCLIRGRNHCVASMVEDIFAELLVVTMGKGAHDVVVLVDCPVYAGRFYRKRRKTIYPDIVVCIRLGEKELRVVHMYELKVNTGWMRKGSAECFNKMVRSWKKMSQYASVKIDGKHSKLIFPDDVKYDLVIVSSVSNEEGKALSQVTKIRSKKDVRFGGWILSDCELNSKYVKNPVIGRKELKPREDFSEMLEILAKEVDDIHGKSQAKQVPDWN